MSDTHDASTCDALPLAVALTQAMREIEMLRRHTNAIANALGKCIRKLDDLGKDTCDASLALKEWIDYDLGRD